MQCCPSHTIAWRLIVGCDRRVTARVVAAVTLQGERHPDEAQSRMEHGGECGRRRACRRRKGNGFDVWVGIARAWFQNFLRGQE